VGFELTNFVGSISIPLYLASTSIPFYVRAHHYTDTLAVKPKRHFSKLELGIFAKALKYLLVEDYRIHERTGPFGARRNPTFETCWEPAWYQVLYLNGRRTGDNSAVLRE
jgi:hypothetical protein